MNKWIIFFGIAIMTWSCDLFSPAKALSHLYGGTLYAYEEQPIDYVYDSNLNIIGVTWDTIEFQQEIQIEVIETKDSVFFEFPAIVKEYMNKGVGGFEYAFVYDETNYYSENPGSYYGTNEVANSYAVSIENEQLIFSHRAKNDVYGSVVKLDFEGGLIE